jgi:outer membrane protein
MRKNFKIILTTCIFIFPTLVFAADKPTGLKPTLPEQPAIATPAEALLKPASPVISPRIGYIDISRIGAESDKGKALKVLLTAKKDAIQGKIDGKKKQLEKLEKSIKAKLATMTPQQRETKSKQFQKKVEEFRLFARSSEEEFFDMQEKETKEFYVAIEQSAVELGKTDGFAAVVIKKELLYIGKNVVEQDVTDALIKALNQSGQKK